MSSFTPGVSTCLPSSSPSFQLSNDPSLTLSSHCYLIHQLSLLLLNASLHSTSLVSSHNVANLSAALYNVVFVASQAIPPLLLSPPSLPLSFPPSTAPQSQHSSTVTSPPSSTPAPSPSPPSDSFPSFPSPPTSHLTIRFVTSIESLPPPPHRFTAPRKGLTIRPRSAPTQSTSPSSSPSSSPRPIANSSPSRASNPLLSCAAPSPFAALCDDEDSNDAEDEEEDTPEDPAPTPVLSLTQTPADAPTSTTTQTSTPSSPPVACDEKDESSKDAGNLTPITVYRTSEPTPSISPTAPGPMTLTTPADPITALTPPTCPLVHSSNPIRPFFKYLRSRPRSQSKYFTKRFSSSSPICHCEFFPIYASKVVKTSTPIQALHPVLSHLCLDCAHRYTHETYAEGRLAHLWPPALESEWEDHYPDFYTDEEHRAIIDWIGEDHKTNPRTVHITTLFLFLLPRRLNKFTKEDLSSHGIRETVDRYTKEQLEGRRQQAIIEKENEEKEQLKTTTEHHNRTLTHPQA